MWSLLQKAAVHRGIVRYRGPIAPPIEQVLGLAQQGNHPGMLASRDGSSAEDAAWAVTLTHPVWGEASVVAPRVHHALDADLLRWGAPSLTADERARAGSAETSLGLRLTTPERNVLKARKHLLRWLRLLMSLDGLVAIDHDSQLFWSQAMLDDELAHDADLDVEALFATHAVYDEQTPGRRVFWLHTHGLEALGAFDFDVVRPSPFLADQAGDCMRALASAALEGHITPSTTNFSLGNPGGRIDLVPADTFDSGAASDDAGLRTHDEDHSGRRAVICEPRGLFGFLRKKPIPSRFLERLEGEVVFNFTKEASQLMAARAKATLDVFKALLAEFGPSGLPNGMKIGFATASDPASREHLWFEVHGFEGDRVDATLLNQPFDVPSLEQNARGWHPIADVSDWLIMSPAGPMTPRNLSAARRLRESGWPGGKYAEAMADKTSPEA